MAFLTSMSNRKTFNYKFSVYVKDDPVLLGLKKRVRAQNKATRKMARKLGTYCDRFALRKITIMARGPRKVNGKLLHPNAFTNLRHEYGVYFDVYCSVDTDAENNLIHEIETGITPTMQKKIDNLRYQANVIELQAKQKVYA
jgi:hypothetical protein